MMPEIFKITSDEGLTFYSINDSYDLPSEFTYTLIGRRKDGVWVKYFDTNDIAKKYFGNCQDYWFKTLSVNGNVTKLPSSEDDGFHGLKALRTESPNFG